MAVTEHVCQLLAQKAKIKGVLAGHIDAMETNSAITLTTTCLSMIGNFFDNNQQWYWKMFRATLQKEELSCNYLLSTRKFIQTTQ